MMFHQFSEFHNHSISHHVHGIDFPIPSAIEYRNFQFKITWLLLAMHLFISFNFLTSFGT